MEQYPNIEINKGLSVGFIIGQLGIGGSEKQLYLLARGLILRGWRVIVINLNSDSVDNWVRPLELSGITVFSLSKTETQMKRLAAIIAILRREKPFILHSWSLYTNFYAAMCGLLARIPVRLGSERGNQEYSLRTYGKWKYSLSLIGLHGVVTNSDLEAQLLAKEKSRLIVKVIANGVDGNGLFSKAKAREILGIPDKFILVAGIGSLTPNKNFEYLIEVMAKIGSRCPMLKLILVGDGPEKSKLLQKASALMPLDRVIFTGSIPDAYKLLRGFDVLCISSLTEGMPNVVLEACAAGIPVVANKVGTIPSIVKNGINGFVVEVGDETKFLKAIEKLVWNINLREEMGMAGQKMMYEGFDSKKMIDNFVSFYQEMIGS